jgi:hypothetical protein
LRVTPIQKTDKKLTCEQIIIEINEAEHYRSEAASEQAVGMGEALMPICWVTGFVDGEVGIKKANARINYLGSTYDLLDCGGKGRNKKEASASAPVQQSPIIVPVLQPRAPALQPTEPLQVAPVKPREIIQPKELEPIKTPVKPQGQGYYKIRNNLGPDEMHEHMDKDGKLYIHSHKHSGPHRHLEDQ